MIMYEIYFFVFKLYTSAHRVVRGLGLVYSLKICVELRPETVPALTLLNNSGMYRVRVQVFFRQFVKSKAHSFLQALRG